MPRSVTARPLVTDLWRLRGFFLGIGGGMLTRSAVVNDAASTSDQSGLTLSHFCVAPFWG